MGERLSLDDQCFANALAFLAANVVSDVAREDLMIEALRDLLPRLSGHRAIDPLRRAARAYLGVLDEAPHDLRRRALAKMALSGPVADFLFWRFAAARSALAEAGAAIAGAPSAASP